MLDKPSTKIEDKLKNIPPKYFWLVASIISAATCLFTFSVSDMLPNGNNTLLRMDMYSQYIPSIEYLMEVLKGNHGYWFSWSNFMGFNNSGIFAYLCMSPFNIVFLLFGKSHALAAVITVVVLKCAASAAFMQLFLSYFLRSKRISTVIFAVCYSLCGYQIAYYCVMNFTDAVYLLPLIMLSIVKLLREGKFIPLTVSYFLLFFSCFYMGYMIGISSFVLGLGYYLYTLSKRDRKVNVQIVVKYVCSVLTAVLMTAIIWLPALIQLFSLGEEDYADPYMWKTNIFLIFNNLFVGEYQDLKGYTPYVYCGMITFLFAFSYFGNKRVKKRERLFSGIMVLTVLLLMIIPPFNKFMHAFDTPQMFGYRYAFVFSFILCIVACRQSVYYRETDKRTIISFVSFCLIIFGAGIAMYLNESHGYKCNRIDVAVANILIIVFWILLINLGKKRDLERFTYTIMLFALVMGELTLNGTMLYRKSQSLNYGNDAFKYARISDENTLKELPLPKDNEFYRMQMMSEIQPNSGLEDGYYSVSSFSSTAPGDLFNALHELGVSEKLHVVFGKGMTPFLRSLLGVKYYSNYEVELLDGFVWCKNDSKNLIAMLAHDQGMSGSSKVCENEKFLSLGFMVDNGIKEFNFSDSPFENQNLIASKMCKDNIRLFENAKWDCESEKGELLEYTRGRSEELDKLAVNLDMESGYLYKSKKEYKDNGQKELSNPDYSGEDAAVFRFTVKDNDKPVYGYFGRDFDYRSYGIIYTPEESEALENIGISHALSNSYINPLGHNEDGDYEEDVILPEGVNKDFCLSINFAEYDEDEFNKAFDILSQNQLMIQEFSDGYVKGTIDAKDGGVMFTSIPYDKGWDVFIDGKEVEPLSLLEGAFLGVDLDAGEHLVEMKYTAAGSVAGAALSGAGVLLFIIFAAIQIKNKKALTR